MTSFFIIFFLLGDHPARDSEHKDVHDADGTSAGGKDGRRQD
jgi:hypothetical protein